MDCKNRSGEVFDDPGAHTDMRKLKSMMLSKCVLSGRSSTLGGNKELARQNVISAASRS